MSRFAVKITVDELRDKVLSAVKKPDKMKYMGFADKDLKEYVESSREYNPTADISDLTIDRCAGVLIILTPQVEKDLGKVSFDTENITSFADKGAGDGFGFGPIVGFQELDNGFVYLGCAAGGDWEQPIFFIIYWDGKKLRGYIPEDGNPYNKKTKTAFNNDTEADVAFIKSVVPDFCLENIDEFEPDIIPDSLTDLEAIKNDIKGRIILKNS